MCDHPLGVLHSVLQISVFCRKMTLLAHVDQLDQGFVFVRHGESNRVPWTVCGKARTARRISETAFFLQSLCFRNHPVIPWSRAVALPAAAQGQPRSVEPHSILCFVGRHEKRTSQVRLLANIAAE